MYMYSRKIWTTFTFFINVLQQENITVKIRKTFYFEGKKAALKTWKWL